MRVLEGLDRIDVGNQACSRLRSEAVLNRVKDQIRGRPETGRGRAT